MAQNDIQTQRENALSVFRKAAQAHPVTLVAAEKPEYAPPYALNIADVVIGVADYRDRNGRQAVMAGFTLVNTPAVMDGDKVVTPAVPVNISIQLVNYGTARKPEFAPFPENVSRETNQIGNILDRIGAKGAWEGAKIAVALDGVLSIRIGNRECADDNGVVGYNHQSTYLFKNIPLGPLSGMVKDVIDTLNKSPKSRKEFIASGMLRKDAKDQWFLCFTPDELPEGSITVYSYCDTYDKAGQPTFTPMAPRWCLDDKAQWAQVRAYPATEDMPLIDLYKKDGKAFNLLWRGSIGNVSGKSKTLIAQMEETLSKSEDWQKVANQGRPVVVTNERKYLDKSSARAALTRKVLQTTGPSGGQVPSSGPVVDVDDIPL